MTKYIAAYGSSAIAMLVLDVVWLTMMGDRLYRPVLGDWMRTKVDFVAAGAFYFIFLFGITFLAVVPALLGMRLGIRIRSTLRPEVFRRMLFSAMVLLGIYTVVRALA